MKGEKEDGDGEAMMVLAVGDSCCKLVIQPFRRWSLFLRSIPVLKNESVFFEPNLVNGRTRGRG